MGKEWGMWMNVQDNVIWAIMIENVYISEGLNIYIRHTESNIPAPILSHSEKEWIFKK